MTLSPCNGGERGLLGVAVDPDFKVNGYLYLYFTRPSPSAPGGCVNRAKPRRRNRPRRANCLPSTITPPPTPTSPEMKSTCSRARRPRRGAARPARRGRPRWPRRSAGRSPARRQAIGEGGGRQPRFGAIETTPVVAAHDADDRARRGRSWRRCRAAVAARRARGPRGRRSSRRPWSDRAARSRRTTSRTSPPSPTAATASESTAISRARTMPAAWAGQNEWRRASGSSLAGAGLLGDEAREGQLADEPRGSRCGSAQSSPPALTAIRRRDCAALARLS